MIIQCPSCYFERDVPDGALRPGKVYKVTCPRCDSVFQFSLPEQEEFPAEAESPLQDVVTPEPQAEAPVAEDDQAVTPAEEASEPMKRAEEEPSSPRLSTEQDEDAPLPPGAVIPSFEREEPKPETVQEEQETAPEAETRPDNVWDSLKNRLAQADGGEEQPEGGIRHREDGRPDGAPWESPEYYGFLGSFTQTMLGVLFHAPDFFRHVKCQFSVIRPILFYVLMSVFQVLCARLWSIKALREISATATDPQTVAVAEQLMQHMNMPLMLLITPFFSIFQAVILAGFYHLMIRMVQPDKADYATTLRVVCYSAAPLVLCIVPMFGSAIATIWAVLTVFVGCRYALGMSWVRTVLALLPLYILELAFVSQIPALMGI